ncbi:MAG: glycosyltransferase [Mariprofundaceae bacterium]
MAMIFKVSVVIPSYNYGAFIANALDSVLSQEGVDVDIVVVDDGSTDDTLDVLHAYEGRIRLFQQENGGVSAARNLGIEKAKCDLIAFLDADDWLLENSLYTRCAYWQQHPDCDWVYSLWKIADSSGEVVGTSLDYFPHRDGIMEGDVFSSLLRGYAGMHIMTPIFRLADVRASGGFRTVYKAAEDYDFLLRMSRGKRVGYCPDVYSGVQRLHFSHLTPHPELRYVAEIGILESYQSDIKARELAGPSYRGRIANLYNYLIWIYVDEKKMPLALKAILHSIRTKPLQGFAYRCLFYIFIRRSDKIGQEVKNGVMQMYSRIKQGEKL